MVKFLICIDNKGYEASLEKWKIYPVVKEKEIPGYVRIIDESGEDYLYPEKYFFPIELPPVLLKKVGQEYFKKKEDI